MSHVVVNVDQSVIRSREELLAFAMGLDSKRPTAWVQYGWPSEVTFDQMYRAYERTGGGNGAVHRLLDGCWQALPRIKTPKTDDVSPWETKVNELFDDLELWAKFKEFDRRNLIGRYSGLIYRVADGKALTEPMERASKLVDIIPVFENQLKVTDWHSDPSDAENYGKPRMFQYRKRAIASQDASGQPDEWADVHPSRVQIFAEGSVGDMYEGVPLLRAGFNDLVNIEKISGGSGESFLKNSARTIVFKYDANAQVQAITTQEGQTKTVREVHEEQSKSINRNQDSSIVMQGGDATTLQTSISDPKPSFEVSANNFAASVRLPFTVIFGQQTGRLASNEDKADAIARYKSRQANELTRIIKDFVRRMQAAGVIEDGKFEVEWPDIAAPSDDEKLGNLTKMTQAMTAAFQAGLPPIFTVEELRKVAGYKEALPLLPMGEGDPAGDAPP
jgi:hypothetical protein